MKTAILPILPILLNRSFLAGLCVEADHRLSGWGGSPASSISPRAGQTVEVGPSQMRVVDADHPPDSELVLTVTRPAVVGDLLLDGAVVLAAGASFSVADLKAGRLSFRHNGRSDLIFDQLHCTVTDGVFPSFFDQYLGIWTSSGQPPQISLGLAPGPWIEGGGAVPVCPDAVFTDADTMSFAGLHLTVSFDAEQARAGDVVEFRHAGNGAGQIAVDGQALAYEGHPIGTWDGGLDGQPLVVTFANQESGPASVQALLRALRYRHAGRDPAAGLLRIAPRPGLSGTDRFTVTVSDRVNPPVAATIVLRVTGFDDACPQPFADPPFAAVAGEVLQADIPWDAAVAAEGGVPAGLVLIPLSATSVRLEWSLPVAEPPGLRSFALLATGLSDHATGRLRVLPRPGGIQ